MPEELLAELPHLRGEAVVDLHHLLAAQLGLVAVVEAVARRQHRGGEEEARLRAQLGEAEVALIAVQEGLFEVVRLVVAEAVREAVAHHQAHLLVVLPEEAGVGPEEPVVQVQYPEIMHQRVAQTGVHAVVEAVHVAVHVVAHVVALAMQPGAAEALLEVEHT